MEEQEKVKEEAKKLLHKNEAPREREWKGRERRRGGGWRENKEEKEKIMEQMDERVKEEVKYWLVKDQGDGREWRGKKGGRKEKKYVNKDEGEVGERKSEWKDK